MTHRLIPWFAAACIALGIAACSSEPATPTPSDKPAALDSPLALASPLATPASYSAKPEVPDKPAVNVAQWSNVSFEWDVPANVPLPNVPADNPLTEAKFQLGRFLFYDRQLSGNGAESCATCHIQQLAFTDGARRSTGSTGQRHPRNAQALVNVAYNSTFTWANPILERVEQQIQIPMFGEFPIELGITGKEEAVLSRFRNDANYKALFAHAFPNDADPISFKNVVYALATFARGLTSFNSPYDRFVGGDKTAMSQGAQRGMTMFLSEQLECHHCHTGFNFTQSTMTMNSTFVEKPFFNTGLYNLDGKGAYPQGNQGIKEVTNDPADMGRFRPPTLRNVALSAPYMHDGSLASLDEVVRFYERGGRKIDSGEFAGDGRLSPLKNGLVAGFQITDAQRQDLLAFLSSLTDESFITNPRFSDPFKEQPALAAHPTPPYAEATPTPQAMPTVPPLLSKGEWHARLQAMITKSFSELEVALRASDLPKSRAIVEQLHAELHALHATSWQLGVGRQHNELEALFHRTLYAPLMAEDAYPPKLANAVFDLRVAVADLANAAN